MPLLKSTKNITHAGISFWFHLLSNIQIFAIIYLLNFLVNPTIVQTASAREVQ